MDFLNVLIGLRNYCVSFLVARKFFHFYTDEISGGINCGSGIAKKIPVFLIAVDFYSIHLFREYIELSVQGATRDKNRV